MTIDAARATLKDDDARFVRWCEASFALCEAVESDYEDWLLCLSRRGLPAETAAIKLYNRTKRPRLDESIESFCMDADDWREFLRAKGFIT